MDSQTAEVTRLLRAWGGGDHAALDQLTPLVYRELRRMAGRYMQRENPGHAASDGFGQRSFSAPGGCDRRALAGPRPFFAISAQMMRRILVDAARARGSGKRGGGAVRLDINEIHRRPAPADSRLVDLDEALESLAQFDARKAKWWNSAFSAA